MNPPARAISSRTCATTRALCAFASSSGTGAGESKVFNVRALALFARDCRLC
jgi:hypothetical protein